jgi:hypothetical protein
MLIASAQAISLTDIGSMHGTKIDNRQLKKQEVHRITSDQIVTFGSEVARGKGKRDSRVSLYCTAAPMSGLSSCVLDGDLNKSITDGMIFLDIYPPRQFKVHIDWDDWR